MMQVTRAKLAVLGAVAAGVVLGAVVGQPGNGAAASRALPKNKTPPTVSGTAEVGQTLTAAVGSWSGNPTSYRYSWSLCDGGGVACLTIGGATAKIYTVTESDVGHTLRVTVTAHNASGSVSATSAATGVVPASGCPAGTGAIQVAQLSPPAQLEIVGESSSAVTRKATSIQLHFQIEACGARPVQGATVFATAIPYNQFAGTEATTAADGTVTLTEARRSGFPASRHQRLLAVFVRVTKPGDAEVGGVSSRLVVSFRLSHG